jgi:hypothetical protein
MYTKLASIESYQLPNDNNIQLKRFLEYGCRDRLYIFRRLRLSHLTASTA